MYIYINYNELSHAVLVLTTAAPVAVRAPYIVKQWIHVPFTRYEYIEIRSGGGDAAIRGAHCIFMCIYITAQTRRNINIHIKREPIKPIDWAIRVEL